MTKYTLLLIGLLQATLCLAQNSFEKIINTSSDEKGNSVKVLADGNYIVAFSSNAFGAGNSDIGIMKTTPNGTVIWTQFYGGNAEDVPSMVLETATGDLLILGMTYSFGAGDRDIYLLKTDNMGNLLWSKTYGSAATDRGFVIIPTLDGGYAIAGSNQLSTGFSYDAYVLKIDSNGNLQWTHSIGGGLNDTCMDIRQNPDGTYMLAISFSSYGAGLYDISVCKLAENGDFIWATITGMSSSDNILTIIPIVGGDYLITGHTKSWGISDWDIFAMRIDSIGNLVWAKTYGGINDDYSEVITNTTDGNFVIQGYTNSFGNGGIDFYLMKINSDGNIIWANTYGGEADEMLPFGSYNTAQETNDGGFIFSIQSHSFDGSDSKAYFVRTNPDGTTICNSNTFSPDITNFNPNITAFTPDIAQHCSVESPATIVTASSISPQTLCTSSAPPPTANFTASDTLICAGQCINFSDLSLDEPTQWQWTFEGANPSNSTLPNPTGICYPMQGSYNVQLVVSNNAGTDTLLLTNYINILPTHTLDTTATICQGESIILGGAAQTQSGIYTDIFTNLAGCDSIVHTQLTVLTPPQLTLDLGSDLLVCTDNEVPLNAQTEGATHYIWSNGSTTPSINALPNHTYSVTISNNCYVASDSITINTNNQLVELSIQENCYTNVQASDYQVIISLYNGVPPYTISGNINTTVYAPDTLLMLNNIPLGTPYTLQITDAAGCITALNDQPECITLPITLVHFSGNSTPKGNYLSWQTATEINNDYFTLQRSNHTGLYETIATLKGAGNSPTTHNYQYTDTQPLPQINYYRLLQTDFDGTTQHIGNVVLHHPAPSNATTNSDWAQLAPNITAHTAQLYFKETVQNVTLSLLDIQGNILSQSKLGNQNAHNSHTLDLSPHPNATYIIYLQADKQKPIALKIVKQ